MCTHKGIVLADIVSVCGDNTLGRECERTRDGFFLVKIGGGGECTLNLSREGCCRNGTGELIGLVLI